MECMESGLGNIARSIAENIKYPTNILEALLGIQTVKEGDAARTLAKLIDVGKEVHFDNHIDLAANPMHCIENRNPAGEHSALSVHRLTRALQAQGIQTDVHLANGIVGGVRVVVHQPDLKRLVLQLCIVHLETKP